MGLHAREDALFVTAEKLARVGVSRVEWDESGDVVALDFHRPSVIVPLSDTIPCPPPPPSSSGVMPIVDPHPEMIPEDEPASEAIARELELLALLPRSH